MTVDNMYLENLEEYVFDENKMVTYKWLSKTLSVHVNEAKRMLFTFADHQRNTKDKEVSLTYLVAGVRDNAGVKTHQFYVVNEEDLETTKARLSPLTSCHVYSVQKAKLKDSNALYTADYTNNKVALAATSSFSAIKNDSIKVRTEAERRPTPAKAPVEEKKPVEVATKSSKPAKKPTGIASMFSKAPVKKESVPDKVEKTTSDNKAKETDKNKKPQQKGVMSFFGKQTANKSSKTETGKKPAAKKSSPTKGKEPVKNMKKNKKESSDEEDDEKVVSNKKRRRIQPEIFESSSEEEMEEEPIPEPSPAPSPVPSPQPSEDEEEPIPPTPPKKSPVKHEADGDQKTTRKNRRRKLVDKTYMDEEGYMVTEKVYESESASEVDEPPKKVEPKKPSPAKKAKPAAKAATKQSSLMSFFKKK